MELGTGDGELGTGNGEEEAEGEELGAGDGELETGREEGDGDEDVASEQARRKESARAERNALAAYASRSLVGACDRRGARLAGDGGTERLVGRDPGDAGLGPGRRERELELGACRGLAEEVEREERQGRAADALEGIGRGDELLAAAVGRTRIAADLGEETDRVDDRADVVAVR